MIVDTECSLYLLDVGEKDEDCIHTETNEDSLWRRIEV